MTCRGAQAALLLVALWSGACAPSRLSLPSGTGTPATDGADTLREATKACGDVTMISAEIGLSGSIGGHGLRARLLAGLASPSSARLEAVAPFGPPIFVFVARDEDATLWLPRERRVLEHGRPLDVLEAVASVPLDATDLRLALTGCPAAPRADEARQLGESWRVMPDGDGDIYLHRDERQQHWRLVAAMRRRSGDKSWRAEYGDFQRSGPAQGLPKVVRLTSLAAGRFDLRLSMSQVEINGPHDAEVFTVKIPAASAAITLEQLRQSGPLAP